MAHVTMQNENAIALNSHGAALGSARHVPLQPAPEAEADGAR